MTSGSQFSRGQLNCDCTRAENRFHLSAKRRHQFSRLLAAKVCTSAFIVGSNAGYTMFWGSVKGTAYPLHSPVSHSLPFPCVTICHHISTEVYKSLSTTDHIYVPWSVSHESETIICGSDCLQVLQGPLLNDSAVYRNVFGLAWNTRV